MAFQQAVYTNQGAGIPGEKAYDGPSRVFPWTLTSTPQLNIVGATWFTVVSEGVAMAGGTGINAGLLVNPKVYANFQTGLGATMTLPDGTIGSLATMGFFFAQLANNAAAIGDLLSYNTTTGALSSVGAVTTFTASSSGTVLTVTGTPVGFVGPGLSLGAPFLPGTVIETNGTGTGGAGTYNLNYSQTVASGTYTSSGGSNGGVVAPAGQLIIPRAKIVLRTVATNGLAIVELTS